MVRVSKGAKGGYGGQDWEQEYHDTNMRQIKNVWDNLSNNAQKILLGWCGPRGPLLGSILKIGMAGTQGLHTKPLPPDAIEQFAAHIHSSSKKQKARGDIPATHQDDTKRIIADYLDAIDSDTGSREDKAAEGGITPEEQFDPETGVKREGRGKLRNVPITDLGWQNAEYETPEGGERPTLDDLISKRLFKVSTKTVYRWRRSFS
jgi:hypothetical protein